jgi:hypothetical protein
MAWLQVLISGLRDIHEQFLAFREDVNLRASFTGQTIVLERMLNMHYYQDLNGNPLDVWASQADTTASGHIWIDLTANLFNQEPVWFESEGQPATVVGYFASEGQPAPSPTYFESENNLSYSFRVMVPVGLVFNEAELRALIDHYLETGYFYLIETY